MAKRSVHHPEFDDIAEMNKAVVALTREPSEYTPADKLKLDELVAEVAQRAENQEFEDAVPEKASLLIYKLACGQYFKAGNKRTALVAGHVFMRKNGFKLDIRNRSLVGTVDRVGVGASTLEDVYETVEGLAVKAPTDRKGWEGAIKESVEANRRFLTDLGS